MNIIQIVIELGRIESEDVIEIPYKILRKEQEKFINVSVVSEGKHVGKIVTVYEEHKVLYGIVELEEGSKIYNIAKKHNYCYKGYGCFELLVDTKKDIVGIIQIYNVVIRVLPVSKIQKINIDEGEKMLCKGCRNVFRMNKIWYDKEKGDMWRCVCGEEYTQSEYDAQRKTYVETTEKQKREEQACILEEQRLKEEAQKALERASKRKRKIHVEEIVEEVIEPSVKKTKKKKDEDIQIVEEHVQKKRSRKKREETLSKE